LTAYVENTTSPSESEISRRLLDYRQREKEVWNDMVKAKRGLSAVGLTDAEIVAEFKNVNGLSNKVINSVMEEEFTPSVVSKRSIENAGKRQVNAARGQEEKDK